MKTWKKWSEGEVEYLSDHLNKTHSREEIEVIAKTLNRSTIAVLNKIRKLRAAQGIGVGRKKYTKGELKKITDAVKENPYNISAALRSAASQLKGRTFWSVQNMYYRKIINSKRVNFGFITHASSCVNRKIIREFNVKQQNAISRRYPRWVMKILNFWK